MKNGLCKVERRIGHALDPMRDEHPKVCDLRQKMEVEITASKRMQLLFLFIHVSILITD